MFRRFGVNFAVLSAALDIVLTLAALHLARLLCLELALSPIQVDSASEFPWPLYILVPLLWVVTFLLTSVYDPRNIYRIVDEVQRTLMASLLAGLLLAGFLFLAYEGFSRWLFVLFLLLEVSVILGWRVIARILFRIRHFPPAQQRVLVVGAGQTGRQVAEMIQQHGWMGLELVGFVDDCQETELPVMGPLTAVREIVAGEAIDDVVIALPQRAYGQISDLVLALHDMPIQVRVVPDYFSLALYKAKAADFGGLPMINLRDPALNPVQRFVKRIVDLLVGGAITVSSLPLFAAIAVAIKFDSPGPVFFRQERVGENGRLFEILKFRSMTLGAEKADIEVSTVNGSGQTVYKNPEDPRVTRVGRFLRRTSLDELPQLFNVLRGEMSLVGPRPELPWLVADYEPWQHRRFAVPQGMTGWWQINGRANRPMYLHTEDDLFYIQNYSLFMDIYILFKTPFVVLRGQGAY